MAQNRAGQIGQWNAHIAYRSQFLQLAAAREEIADVVGVVDELGALDDLLARRALDVDFKGRLFLAVHAEGQGFEASRVFQVLRDPGIAGSERSREALDQHRKETFASFGGGTLQNNPQRVFAIQGTGKPFAVRGHERGSFCFAWLLRPTRSRKRRKVQEEEICGRRA